MANGPNPLTSLQFQVQDLITADTPETLEAAENLIRSFAQNLPPGAGPQALSLQKQLATKREQRNTFNRVQEIARPPADAAPETSAVDLVRTGGLDREGPARLEDFGFPTTVTNNLTDQAQQFQIPEGGREIGRLVSSDGTFARAIIEGPRGPEVQTGEAPPFDTGQIAELGLLLSKVKGGSSILTQLIKQRGAGTGGAKLTALQSESLVKAGVNLGNRSLVTQITQSEFKLADELDAKETSRLKSQANAATKDDKLDEFLTVQDMLKVVNPVTLQGPQDNLTRRRLGQGLKDGTFIISTPKNITSARELQGAAAPLLRLFDLTKKLIVAQPGGNLLQALDFFQKNQLALSADVAIFTTSKDALALQLAAIVNQGRPSEPDKQAILALFPTDRDSIKTGVPKMINVMRLVNDLAKAKLGVGVIDPRFFKILKEGQAPTSTFKNSTKGAAPQFRVGPDGQLQAVQ